MLSSTENSEKEKRLGCNISTVGSFSQRSVPSSLLSVVITRATELLSAHRMLRATTK